jgi:phospholipid/cholesterol/gamma-HCH transport system substrate-binding protein
MELRYQREAAVGLFLIVAAVLFVIGLIWLHGRSLTVGTMVEITFTDVSGLKVGDPVRTSGVNVGQVSEIKLVAPGRVDVFLNLHAAPAPRRDARAVVRAADFFGARFVDYDPGSASQPLLPGDSLAGERELGVDQMVAGIADPGHAALENAANFLSPQNAADLRSLLVETREAVAKLGNAAKAPSEEAARAMASLTDLLQQLDQVVAGQAAAQTMQNMQQASRNLADVTATLRGTTVALDSVLNKINTGRGSVGRMVNDTTLVTDLHNATTALTALLTDLKAHPGRYVHVSVF